MRPTIRGIVTGVAALSLTSCATLPQREATAFKAMAKADANAFGKGTTAEVASLTEAAIIQPSRTGLGIEAKNCEAELPATAKCEIRLTGEGAPSMELVEGAPRTRKLIAAITSYGAAMADLAEAKDVAAAKANVDSAATSIETLATLTGVGAPAAGIVKMVAAIAKGRLTEARRKALLEAAIASDPAIQVAATNLGKIATEIRNNILDSATVRISRYQLAFDRASSTGRDLQKQYDALPKGASGDAERLRLRVLIDQEQSNRVDAGNAIVRTVADIRLARGMQVDFNGLAKAHAALIDALRNPKVGLTPAFEGLNSFLDAVSSAKGD